MKYKSVPKHVLLFFFGWHFEIMDIILALRERLVCSVKYEVCCVGFFVKYSTESCGLRNRDLSLLTRGMNN